MARFAANLILDREDLPAEKLMFCRLPVAAKTGLEGYGEGEDCET